MPRGFSEAARTPEDCPPTQRPRRAPGNFAPGHFSQVPPRTNHWTPCRTLLWATVRCLQTTPFMCTVSKGILSQLEELHQLWTFRHLSPASLRHGLSMRRDFGITQGLDQHLLAQGSRAGQQPLPTSVSSSLWAKGQLASLPSVTSP